MSQHNLFELNTVSNIKAAGMEAYWQLFVCKLSIKSLTKKKPNRKITSVFSISSYMQK
jgi:hypothetical protein